MFTGAAAHSVGYAWKNSSHMPLNSSNSLSMVCLYSRNKQVGKRRSPLSAQGMVCLAWNCRERAARFSMSLRSDVPASKSFLNLPAFWCAIASSRTLVVTSLSMVLAGQTEMLRDTRTAEEEIDIRYSYVNM